MPTSLSSLFNSPERQFSARQFSARQFSAPVRCLPMRCLPASWLLVGWFAAGYSMVGSHSLAFADDRPLRVGNPMVDLLGPLERSLLNAELHQGLGLERDRTKYFRWVADESDATTKGLVPIDVRGFGSSIHHWRDLRDESRFIQVEPDQASYSPEQVAEIVENILLFQRSDGGWPKDYDMLAVLTPAQRAAAMATRDFQDSSYDNNNLHSQVKYLAEAVAQTGNPEWQAACERGFDFLIRSQYANGGFPQRFPNAKSYHAHITLNDGVMIGILRVLADASGRQPYFDWLDAVRRRQATEAVQRGVDCLLRCQIEVEGKKTGWCQQHDQTDFRPRSARTFELASICPQETSEVVRFLQQQPDRSPPVEQAIAAAIEWLRTVQLSGIRVERVSSTREEFLRHTVDFDVVVVDDPQAPPLWARHYEMGTNRPIFAGRDGVKKYTLAEIERERRTGTAWYGGWPRSLVE